MQSPKINKNIAHGSLILFLLCIPLILYFGTKNSSGAVHNPFTSIYYWIFECSFIGFFYLFTYYLTPRFFLTKRYLIFVTALLLLLTGFFFLKPFELVFMDILVRKRGKAVPPYDPWTIDILSIISFFMFVALGLFIQVTRQWRLTETRAQQAETDKANAELAFLKAQINPHFLFNTLHTIYALILTRNPIAGDAVLKLSNIMRYVTDDAKADFVGLPKEVATITDFIELQRLQHGKKVKLHYTVTGVLDGKMIAPLILMTYIENAFKYGISNHKAALITIRLKVTKKRILFLCENQLFATPRIAERTGIGLINTQKRLEYLYARNFELNITSQNGLYSVNLALPLKYK